MRTCEWLQREGCDDALALTLYTLTSISIFSIHVSFGTDKEILYEDQSFLAWQSFPYSHDLNEWFSHVTVRRNVMLVTVKG